MVTGRREKPDAALFAGRGKVEEIGAACVEHHAELVIFNHPLSGVQERNLERELSCRVIDRRTLILDIFAQRARSAEGKLAVELAQLEHLSTRPSAAGRTLSGSAVASVCVALVKAAGN